MKLPGAYKNRDKRKAKHMPQLVKVECRCGWTMTVPPMLAEAALAHHFQRCFGEVVAEKKNTA